MPIHFCVCEKQEPSVSVHKAFGILGLAPERNKFSPNMRSRCLICICKTDLSSV